MYIIFTVHDLINIKCVPDKEVLESKICHEKRFIADDK